MVIPILSQGMPRVMLVLENRLHANVFSPERLDAILLIAGQLAVSFDNARARSQRRTIVLPESEDERVLRAAEELVHLDIADLVLLGAPEEVAARAAQLGVDLGGSQVVDPATSPLREELATYVCKRSNLPLGAA